MDVEDIPPGVDFERFIGDAVARCDLLIALIGPQWLNAHDRTGQRRLDLADDFTRLEVESALKRDIRVIPVLVGGTQMPSADELPDSLRSLARRQNFVLPDRGWDEACRRLGRAIEEAVAPPLGPVVPREEEQAVTPPKVFRASASIGFGRRHWAIGLLLTTSAVAVLAIAISPDFQYLGPPDRQPPDTQTPGPPDTQTPEPPHTQNPGLTVIPPPVAIEPENPALLVRPMGPLVPDLVYLQGDYRDAFASSAEACRALCASEPRCEAMTFIKSQLRCWLKDRVPGTASSTDMISAVKLH